MDKKNFPNPSGELVLIPNGAKPYYAFVPAPLPPVFDVTLDFSNRLAAASDAIGELRGVGQFLPNPQLLIDPLIRREAVLSSRIEGTQTDVLGLYEYEAEQEQARHERRPTTERDADRQEVYNYVKTLELGLKKLEVRPASLNVIRELHGILMDGVRGEDKDPGEFRKRQNMIGGVPGHPESARFMPAPPLKLLECLDSLEKYINIPDQLHPLVRLGLIHYQFETIHPFLDGNGRIGRLLLSLLPVSWGLISRPLLHLSGFFERHRDQYCQLLFDVSSKSMWTEWIMFFLEACRHEAKDASFRANELCKLQLSWRTKLQEQKVKAVALRAADSFFVKPYIWPNDLALKLKVSKPTALSALKILQDAGLLTCATTKYGYLFTAPSVISVVA